MISDCRVSELEINIDVFWENYVFLVTLYITANENYTVVVEILIFIDGILTFVTQ